MAHSSMLLAMLTLPLIGAFLNGLVIRTPHTKKAGVIGTAFSGTAFVIALMLFFHVVKEGPVSFTQVWFSTPKLTFQWGFLFDSLTATMSLVVTGIGTLIHLYSIGYMSHEPTPSRYFAYLNLFLFSMLTLICGDNLVVMFVGWEGVGLCSYLLIGYWYKDIEKANAGMKAFLVNRIGDAGFLIGIFLCLLTFGSVNFHEITEMVLQRHDLSVQGLNLIALFLFIGAMGKSAQIPLYVWLPDAMAGPTPVSALIHAATMVTSGIYLIVRLNPLFALAGDTSLFIATIGATTALMAASIALVQRDIKKVLAYSTVSQLGLMFLALGTRNYFAAFFHVITHAFFKALLFLGAGSVIHALDGEQDIFNMGGLKKELPVTHLTFLVGTLAIAGIPPLAGFFSKDLILYGALKAEQHAVLFWLIGSVASAFTAFYMARLYSMVFLGSYRGHAHAHESPPSMTIPLIVLAVGSAVAGFIGMPHEFGMLPNYLGHFLSSVVGEESAEVHTFISENAAMGLATALGIIGVVIGIVLYRTPSRVDGLTKVLKPIHTLLLNKFYIDELYGLIFVKPFLWLSSFLARFFDVRIIDGLVILPSRLARAAGSLLSLFQTGLAQFYLLIMLLGAMSILWFSLRGTVI